MPLAATGVERSVVVPSPSWPLELAPQQLTVPAMSRAQLCWLPLLIVVTPESSPVPVMSLTASVVGLEVVVPSPSWPF